MIYNPRINNHEKRVIKDNVYALGMPTTILDLMVETNTFRQPAQQDLARRFAANYEHSQSYLRPPKESIRFFLVNPGGSQWVLDNGRNLRVLPSYMATDLDPVRFEWSACDVGRLYQRSNGGRGLGFLGGSRRVNFLGCGGAFWIGY